VLRSVSVWVGSPVLRSVSVWVTIAAVLSPVVVVTGCTAVAASHPPEIVSLTAKQDLVAPKDSCLIECIAKDEDGDELTYTWTAGSGTVNGYAGTVAWTAPENEGLYKISVEVSDGSGLPPASATVTIRVKNNHYPVIDGIGADADWVRPGESCVIRCVADDVDGDPLQYRWEADCGSIESSTSTATWTAPEFEGTCTIRVYVSDGYGGERHASTQVRVAKNEPLVVTDMVVTALGDPRFLRNYDERFKIYKGETCTICCVVNEPERITSYEWTDDGAAVTVFPTGSERFVFEAPNVIRWTAPQERGEYVITVVARDDDGHFAEKSVTLKVETCTCAFPSEERHAEE